MYCHVFVMKHSVVYIICPASVCASVCAVAPFQDERTPECLQWSYASTGGSGSAEQCARLASARSARRLPAASPCDAAAVMTREPKWLVTVKVELHLFE